MQKYKLSRQTHEMTIVLRLKFYKILLYTARMAYENTYDMRAIVILCVSVPVNILHYSLDFQIQGCF